MTSSTVARVPAAVRRLLVLPALAVGLAGSLSGCDSFFEGFGDTPLEITADEIGWAPGDDVTGEVVNPDGTMTVTLAPAPAGPRAAIKAMDLDQDVDAPGVVLCDFDRDPSTYSCPTAGLDLGVYVVQVTDAKQTGEGTQTVSVVVSDVPDYDPTAGIVPVDMATGERDETEAYLAPTAGEPTDVPLAGWAPGTTVTVQLTGDGEVKPFLTRRATIAADGTGQLRLPALKRGYYGLVASDGTWAQGLYLHVTRSS